MDLMDRVEKVKELYLELLEREADQGGLHTYSNANIPMEKVRECLMASTEYHRLQAKKQNNGLVITPIEENLVVGTRPPKVTDILKEADLVIDIYGEELEGHEELIKYHQVNAFPGSVIGVDEVVNALQQIHGALEEGNNVVVLCDDGVGSASLIILWYISQGFDEDAAKMFALSRISVCDIAQVSAMIGPWHTEAVTGLFKTE